MQFLKVLQVHHIVLFPIKVDRIVPKMLKVDLGPSQTRLQSGYIDDC
jgi:hypothetical protein